jgi:hypothetical protein
MEDSEIYAEIYSSQLLHDEVHEGTHPDTSTAHSAGED